MTIKRIFPLYKPAWFIFCLAFLLSTTICISSVVGGEVTNETDQTIAADSIPELTVEKKQQRWAAFPIIASSPETGLMLGGMLFHFFPTEKPGQEASTIDLMAFGTAEGQYGVSLSPNIFINKGLYRFNASIYANSWQANYYHIGTNSPEDYEEYDSKTFGTILILERRFFDSLIVDLTAHYENTNMDIEAGGMLSTGNIDGSEDGEYIGVGLALGYDTRDNTNGPSKGILAKYENITYDDQIGSDLDFQIHTFDLRYYRQSSFIKDSVIAWAAQVKSSKGEVPFYYLPTPDGTFVLRGIENGRYKDNHMLALQTEYRFPLKWRFSGTVFAELAQVANEFSDMELKEIKTSIGFGIRYALNPDQRFNIRGDIAWVDDGVGMIINVREAF